MTPSSDGISQLCSSQYAHIPSEVQNEKGKHNTEHERYRVKMQQVYLNTYLRGNAYYHDCILVNLNYYCYMVLQVAEL